MRKLSGPSSSSSTRASINSGKSGPRTAVPEYVLQAAEAAVQARGKAREKRSSGTDGEDTLVQSEKIGNRKRKSMASDSFDWAESAFEAATVAEAKSCAASQHVRFDELYASFGHECGVRSSIGIKIWMQQRDR